MSVVQTQNPVVDQRSTVSTPEITIYSHSRLLYWWPVWAIGYAMAALTWFDGEVWTFRDSQVLIHPSKNVGVIFTVVTLLVIAMTHASVRGVASLTVIVGILAITFLFAYLGWWDDIFNSFYFLAMFMNLGFYVFFSTGILILWLLAFFVFDRMTYWRFRPGQMVVHTVFGGGEQTFDSNSLSINKLRDDLFRHWILGLGSGDLHITASGAVRADFTVPNVLFINSKLQRIQNLVAMKPDETPQNVITAGNPD